MADELTTAVKTAVGRFNNASRQAQKKRVAKVKAELEGAAPMLEQLGSALSKKENKL